MVKVFEIRLEAECRTRKSRKDCFGSLGDK